MSKGKLPDVRIDDIWQDNDPRQETGKERRLRVVRVPGAHAVATAADPGELPVECMVVRGRPAAVGRFTAIRLRRFRPTSTGYRLVERDGVEVAS